MTNYSRNYEVVLTEKKAVYNESPIIFKEADKGTSAITFVVKRENQLFDLTGLTAKFFCKDENGVIYAVEDTDKFVNGETKGTMKVILTDEILAVPSKFIGQLELHDTETVYTFEIIEFEVINKFFND